MKKFLLIGCVGVPVLLILVLVIAFVAMPSDYAIETATVINAPTEKIHSYVNSPKRWPEWTVWNTEKYPTMVTTYSGPESGVGAKSEWTEEQGNGSMWITESDPATGIDFILSFEGFGESQGRVHYKSVEGGTEVTMGLEGEMPGIWKLAIPFFQEVMVVEHNESLEGLKKVAEGS